MFKVVLLVTLLGVVSCDILHAPAALVAPAAIHTGSSAQFRSQDVAGNFAFGYNEDHATGGTFRRETGNAALGTVVGSYGLRDADGRLRTVNYVADRVHGFRAQIQTNEPGVEPKDPAAVAINKPLVAAAVPTAPVVAAPAPVAPAAPLYAPAPVAFPAAPAAVVAEAPAVPLAHSYQSVVSSHAIAAPAVAAPLAAPLAHAHAAPLAHGHLAPAATVVNSYVAPAAWGYTLGVPPTFGYTIRKK